MNIITIDFETYYTDKDLGFKTQTTEEYVRDERFEVVGVAVQVCDVLIDHGVGFKVAAGVDDLCSR